MITYKLHTDVVLEKVDTENLLVALRPAWKDVPSIKWISPLKAGFWGGLAQGWDEEKLIDNIYFSSPVNKNAIRDLFQKFISEMQSEGYITISEINDDVS